MEAGLLVAMMMGVVCTVAGAREPTTRERFQAELDSLHSRYGFPGATAAYVLPDGTVEGFAVGLDEIERGIPMQPDSRMLAASIGKTFVGATVLALAQEGLLTLDDPVAKWLGDRPWFERLPNHDSTSLWHLLHHSSGIPNHVESEEFARAFNERWKFPEDPFTAEELIAFVLDQPPLFAAGESWHYTDTGYLLLGLVIESAAGNPWRDEVARRFLKPIGLTRTQASDRVDLPGLAAGYMSEDNPFGLPPKTTSANGRMVWNPGIEGAGGGFVSNPRDLVVWGRTLYEGRAMDGDYLEEVLTSVPVGGEDSRTSYGISVAIHADGPLGPTYGHGGWIPGYTSSLRYYPDLRIGVAFQINTDIGTVDGSTQLVPEMERGLAEIVAAASGRWRTTPRSEDRPERNRR